MGARARVAHLTAVDFATKLTMQLWGVLVVLVVEELGLNLGAFSHQLHVLLSTCSLAHVSSLACCSRTLTSGALPLAALPLPSSRHQGPPATKGR